MAKPALLVVDDELANLQKLRRTFIQDFEVYAAQSGEEAMQLLREHSFRAIITDQRMPGSSGVDLLRESLKHSPQAIRIILTGYTDVEDLMGAINQGQVHRYITKPWDPFSLRQTVLQDVEHWDLKRENEFLVHQMEIAAEVQRMLYPRALPPFPRLDYVGICRPARIVGGDYYDFLPVQPGQLLISVGDISGKGISAALLMANLQGLVRSLAPLHQGEVKKLAETVNHQLCLSIDGSKFASLFCALFDADSGTLDYVNAGHCPALIFRASGGPIERLEPTGTVLGLFPDARFQRGQVQLGPGDLLVAYTDGVVEAESLSHQEFGEERLNELVRAHAGHPLPELAEMLLEQVARFAAHLPQQDDRTVVLAQVRG
ncbi:MAG: SpoIIE family protein phosphatase [Acidobacteriota bacterium]